MDKKPGPAPCVCSPPGTPYRKPCYWSFPQGCAPRRRLEQQCSRWLPGDPAQPSPPIRTRLSVPNHRSWEICSRRWKVTLLFGGHFSGSSAIRARRELLQSRGTDYTWVGGELPATFACSRDGKQEEGRARENRDQLARPGGWFARFPFIRVRSRAPGPQPRSPCPGDLRRALSFWCPSPKCPAPSPLRLNVSLRYPCCLKPQGRFKDEAVFRFHLPLPESAFFHFIMLGFLAPQPFGIQSASTGAFICSLTAYFLLPTRCCCRRQNLRWKVLTRTPLEIYSVGYERQVLSL